MKRKAIWIEVVGVLVAVPAVVGLLVLRDDQISSGGEGGKPGPAQMFTYDLLQAKS